MHETYIGTPNATEIYTVKHVVDRVANEPRNVGVIAVSGYAASDQVALRFLGIDRDGSVSRRPYSAVPKDVYLAWVDYFTRKTRQGGWDDIKRAAMYRPSDFYLDHVLTLTEGGDVERAADEYFAKLVHPRDQHLRRAEAMREQVDKVFKELELSPERDVECAAEIGDKPVTVSFGYFLEGDAPLYMDQMPARGLDQAAQAFAWRTTVASRLNQAARFAAFVDLENDPDEKGLRSIESVAFVVDPVHDYKAAVETVASLVRV